MLSHKEMLFIHSFSVLLATKKGGSEGGPYAQNDSAPFSVHFSHTLLIVCRVICAYTQRAAGPGKVNYTK